MAVAMSGNGEWVVAQRVDAESDPPRERLYAMSALLNWPVERACLPPMRRQQPDDNGLTITALSLSRNGKVMAVGGRGRPVQIMKRVEERWMREATLPPAALGGKLSSVGGTGVALSGDGNRLAVADESVVSDGFQGMVLVAERLADGAWGRAVPVTWSGLPVRGRIGSSVALSADGQTLVIGLSDEQDELLVLRRHVKGWALVARVIQPLSDGRMALALALSSEGRWLAVGSGGPSADDAGNELPPPGELALLEITPQGAIPVGRWQSPDAASGDYFAQQVRIDQAGHVWALDPFQGRVCRYPLPGRPDAPSCTLHREAPPQERVDPVPVEDFDVSDDGQRVLLGITRDPHHGLLFLLQAR